MGQGLSFPQAEPAAANDGSSAGLTSVARGLTKRHFPMQGNRPRGVADIDLLAMHPSLRCLLFTDGTVTRTLEAQALAPVTVDVLSQRRSVARGEIARNLEVTDGTDAVRRRVVIAVGSLAAPAIWAESYMLPSRLPPGFLGVLHDSPDGIGESLQQVKLESWRDMLWFGLDSPPSWVEESPGPRGKVLHRLYRVIAAGRPTMLISESFAIELRTGVYHLAA